jgi:hypothetical protein
MATNQLQANSKLRHLSTFTSSGTFTPPPGCNLVYVAIQGSSGGGSAGASYRYTSSGTSGQNGIWGAGYVQVAPGVACSVVVGAAGGRSAASNNAAGGNGGTSTFDNAITVVGGRGGNSNPGASFSSQSSLPTVNPGASTLTRVTSAASSSSNVTTGGSGAYGPAQGGIGQQATIYIYAY